MNSIENCFNCVSLRKIIISQHEWICFAMLFNLSKLQVCGFICAIISGYVCWQNIHVFGQIGNIFPNTNCRPQTKNSFKNLIMKFIGKKNRDGNLVWHKIVPKNNKMCQFGVKFINRIFMIVILNVEPYGKYIKPNSIYKINQINVCYWWQKGFQSAKQMMPLLWLLIKTLNDTFKWWSLFFCFVIIKKIECCTNLHQFKI